MATIQYVIFKHHKKQDNTFNIKFRLTHKGKQVYHSSVYFVLASQLKKDFTIKDTKVLDAVNSDLAAMRRRIEKFGFDIDMMSASDILNEITRPTDENTKINFVEYANNYLADLLINGKTGSYRRIRQTVNHLNTFIGKEFFEARMINSNFLKEFDSYLRKPKRIIRKGGRGTTIERESDGLENKGVHAVMTNLKIILNACKKDYNTEYTTLLPNDPFKYYEIPVAPLPRKRGADLSVDDLVYLRDSDLTGRAKIGRDIFMLSFYLCGMNAIDIYEQSWVIKNGRLEYERSKTREKRKDNAFISIKIPKEALVLLDQYTKQYLHNRYSSHESFLNAINAGLGKDISFYHARHVFATLAANKFGYEDSEIGERISQWRIGAKIPQSELAKDSGVSESSIGRTEVGRRAPTIELLQYLRNKHNVDLNYILCGE